MATRLKQWVLAMGILCLLQPAIAVNPDFAKAIASKSAQLEKTQKKAQSIIQQIETLEKEKKQIEIDITRFSIDVKRLSLNTNPNEATKTALGKAQFEVKRAEFNLQKNTSQLNKLYQRLEETRDQKRIYQAQLDQLQEDRQKGGPAPTAPKAQAVAPIAAQEKARRAEIEKQKQIEAVKARELAATQERARLAELEKQKQLQAQKAREAAATQERARLAEIEKQKQIEARKARELAATQERARLAELEKQKQLADQKAKDAAAEQARQEQAEREKAALAAKQAEDNLRQVREQEEKSRLQQQQLEQQRQQAMASAAPAPHSGSGLNAAVDASGKPEKPLTPQQKAQKKFIQTSNTLPPAESALTLAMARSLDAAADLPALGNTPNLEVANPVGSNPRTVGVMKYLGNNQYILEMRVNKGKQEFLLGEHSFVKNIPEHFDGIRCLLLVDARNKSKPTFQLVVAGG